jgi:hypothetical protein
MSTTPDTPKIGDVVIVAQEHDGRFVVFQWRSRRDGGGAADWDAVVAQVGPGKRFRRCQAAPVEENPR